MRNWRRDSDMRLRSGPGLSAALVTLLAVSLAGATVTAAGVPSPSARPPQRSRIYEFLVRNGVPIDAKIQLAKVSAVIKTRYKVRSVVKIIRPERLPGSRDLEEIRKRIRSRMRKGLPIRFDVSKMPRQLDLLRENILAGEAIEFHPSEKLGELELFFSKNRSLKVEIGYDMFYIRIGKNDCTFRSRSLRRQLKDILQPREVKPGERIEDRSGRGRPSRKATR